MKRKYSQQNVYDALQERLKFFFEEFDNIYISFSGGKDSGLLLNLVLDFQTKNKKSRVIFIGKIPDNTDDIKSTKDIPSWKRMCYCILKNDHTCRFMGFGITREQQHQIDMIRDKYKSIEEMEYDV